MQDQKTLSLTPRGVLTNVAKVPIAAQVQQPHLCRVSLLTLYIPPPLLNLLCRVSLE